MERRTKQKVDDDVRKSVFADRKKHQAMEELYRELASILGAVMNFPFVKGWTQREEFVRAYALAARSKEESRLPYVADGASARERNKMRCLGAELSCLITAIWMYDVNQTDPNMEIIRDSFEYIDQLLRDPGTIRVAEMPLCRYRLVNSRILNGDRMVENGSDEQLKALADKYAAEDKDLPDETKDNTVSEED